MDRLYHQRFTLAAKSCITIITLLAVYLFWFRSLLHAVIGILIVLLLVFMIERVIHTSYTLTDDGYLLISYGRFFHSKRIPISDIIKISKHNTSLKMSHYILIEYGADNMVSVLPEDENSFIEELNRRLKKVDESL